MSARMARAALFAAALLAAPTLAAGQATTLVASDAPPPVYDTTLLQVAPPTRSIWSRIPADLSGQVNSVSELYRHSGNEPRRPGQSWRLSMSPRATVFGEFGMGFDVLLSSEGSELRQNVDQFGFNPTWRWVTLHAGDFSKAYTPLTVTGTRVRGGGIDLAPGRLRASVQAGRVQRTVARSGAAAYQRNLMAASLGYGRVGETHVTLTLLKGKDDPNSLEQTLVVIDTSFADTAIVSDSLRFAVTPQENLVVALGGRLDLLGRKVSIEGEVGASLYTRDLRSRVVEEDELGALATLNPLQPIRLSTSGDLAYSVEGTVSLGVASLRGGYESIGPGYNSMGIPHLIGDRRGYNVSGNLRLLGNRLTLQGQMRNQRNDVLGQKATPTERGSRMGGATLALPAGASASLTVVTSSATTAASDVKPGMEYGTLAATLSTSAQARLFGRGTTLSLSYGYQQAEDALPGSVVPPTSGHNLTVTTQLALSPTMSLAPSLSAVSNVTGDEEAQRNVLLGFGARGKFIGDGKLTTSANVSHAFSHGREVFTARAEAGYPLPFGTALTVQLRHLSYSAFATKPAFSESFATFGLARSF